MSERWTPDRVEYKRDFKAGLWMMLAALILGLTPLWPIGAVLFLVAAAWFLLVALSHVEDRRRWRQQQWHTGVVKEMRHLESELGMDPVTDFPIYEVREPKHEG